MKNMENIDYTSRFLAGKMTKCFMIFLPLIILFTIETAWASGTATDRFFKSPAITITGKVTGENGEPLQNVSVTVKGSNKGTTTDASGNFSITVPDDAILVFSSVGYEPAELSVAGKTTVTISLKQSSKLMDQVIVVGYGSARKKDLTGSSVSIRGSDIANIPVLTATQALQGKASGVQITSS